MPVKNKTERAAEAATDHGVAEVFHLEPREGETLIYEGKSFATTIQVPKQRRSEVTGDYTVLGPEEAARRPAA